MIRMTTTVVAVASVLFAARAEPYRVTIGEDWVPVDFRKGVETGSALDFSCFGLADAPAGKHGWLEVRGGHFVFPDSPDVPRRFYGPNVVFDGCCPVGDDAAMLAERILRMGYNSVRLHQADRALIVGDNGEEVDRREYAPEKIDRLDRFCAECFKRGIYVTTDLYCSRNVLWGDVSERMGHDPGEPLDYHMFKAMIMFDDRAYAEWREAARKFLAHRNPYTGRTYAEEPGMPFVSLVNETNLAKNWATLKDIPLVRAAWKECFGSDDVASSKETTAFGDFEAWLEERFFVKAKRFLREELGVRALLANQNIGQNRPPLQRVREKLYDYNDGHTYEAHPRRRRGAVGTCSDNDPTAVEWMGGAARANAAIAGKPTVCSEWDYSCPARYRSCAGLLMGTLMSQQDFSAAWRYGWICSLGNRCDELKDGCVFPARPFSGLTDPVGLATDRMAALLFLRGDAPVMSGPGVCLRLTDSAFVREDCIIPRSDKAFPFGGVWECRFVQAIAAPVPSGWREMRFEDGEAAKSSSIPYPLSRDPSAVLNRNPAAKTLTVATPRSCGGFAFPSSGTVEVGPLAFRLGRSHATVYAASVDSGPTTLSLSNRILVMHLTCLQSEGSEFEDDSFRVWLKNGNVPVIADGDARISLRLERPSEYRVWVLDTAGARKEVVPCVADGSTLSFAAHVRGSDGKARLYYEITRVEGDSEDATVSFVTDIAVERPKMPWLFAGFGFQNAESRLTALMSDEFRDQRAIKSFRELAPSFSRVYVGMNGESKESLDRFADYYDKTFRQCDTTIYAVGGAMPAFADKLDVEAHAEGVAKSLEYLVKERDCRKIRFYCLTNELMSGDQWAYFKYQDKMPLFKDFHQALYDAFRRHGLDIQLAASDGSYKRKQAEELKWTVDNMDLITGIYCTHYYDGNVKPGDVDAYEIFSEQFTNVVALAMGKKKRWMLGEFGIKPPCEKGVMIDDRNWNGVDPQRSGLAALTMAEMAMAAINAGAYAVMSWSFCDYPDPFVVEDSHDPAGHARYESGKAVYKPDMKYNKWGVFRWSDVNRDFGPNPTYFTLGLMSRYFRKGANVLTAKASDPLVRATVLQNRDGTMTAAVVNLGEKREITLSGWETSPRGARLYLYDSANPQLNPFGDLPSAVRVLTPEGGAVRFEIPENGMAFVTTDYVERVPAPVKDVKVADGRLTWTPVDDPDHCYYRVYKDGNQIASTVATSLPVKTDDVSSLTVKSVDKWGNEGR